YTAPRAAADALRWRHATLNLARERAHQLGLDGAAFPWRTIRGQETSGYWPAGTAAFHINADIADAVARYCAATGDDDFERDAAQGMVIPWDEELGVHPQSEGFTSHQVWNFDRTEPDQYPLLLNFPYFELYRKQVVKQADLVLALHWRGDAFTGEQKARNFSYYEPLTVRDSSLSACTQAIVAAEVGHLELAYDYFGEAALMDLHDLEHNTRD